MTKPLLAILLLLPIVCTAEECIGIKDIYLGMTIEELENVTKFNWECELSELETDLACKVLHDGLRSQAEIWPLPITLAGQDCLLESVGAFNGGEIDVAKFEPKIYYAKWRCPRVGYVRDALEQKYGPPSESGPAVWGLYAKWRFSDQRVIESSTTQLSYSVRLVDYSVVSKREALEKKRRLADI